MTLKEYQDLHDTILAQEVHTEEPYTNPEKVQFVKLNQSRQQRWFKKLEIPESVKAIVKSINTAQQWILITEPWCGDSPHNLPFIYALTELNPLIRFDIELRDSAPHRIDHYLTNGGKAIPKLVVLDEIGNDVFTWGPRPNGAQSLAMELKENNVSYEEKNIRIQQWYNKDKGASIINELHELIRSTF